MMGRQWPCAAGALQECRKSRRLGNRAKTTGLLKSVLHLRQGFAQHFLALFLTEAAEFFAQCGPAGGQDGDGQQGCVARAGGADSERPHGNAGRHLHGGEQRIQALQGRAFHRHAQHRKQSVGGADAGQVSRARYMFVLLFILTLYSLTSRIIKGAVL